MFIKIHNSVIKGDYPFRLAASRQATFPKGTALGTAGSFPPPLKPSPSGGRWRVAPDEGQDAATPCCHPLRRLRRQLPQGDALWAMPETFSPPLKPSPWTDSPRSGRDVAKRQSGERVAKPQALTEGVSYYNMYYFSLFFSHSRSFNPHSRRISFVFA